MGWEQGGTVGTGGAVEDSSGAKRSVEKRREPTRFGVTVTDGNDEERREATGQTRHEMARTG